jgi:hypothetical protein
MLTTKDVQDLLATTAKDMPAGFNNFMDRRARILVPKEGKGGFIDFHLPITAFTFNGIPFEYHDPKTHDDFALYMTGKPAMTFIGSTVKQEKPLPLPKLGMLLHEAQEKMLEEVTTPSRLPKHPKHYDDSIIEQEELDIKPLERRLIQAFDQRDRYVDVGFSYKDKIPLDIRQRIVEGLTFPADAIEANTTLTPKSYYCGISVSDVHIKEDGHVYKGYCYPSDAIEMAYRQYRLAEIGIAPPIIELPDLYLNVDFSTYETALYHNELASFVSRRARILGYNCSGRFASACQRRIRLVRDALGIDWHDTHCGNIGFCGNHLVILDLGGMTFHHNIDQQMLECEVSSLERVKEEQDKDLITQFRKVAV